MTDLPYKTVYYYLNESNLAIDMEKDYFTETHSYRILWYDKRRKMGCVHFRTKSLH